MKKKECYTCKYLGYNTFYGMCYCVASSYQSEEEREISKKKKEKLRDLDIDEIGRIGCCDYKKANFLVMWKRNHLGL